MPKRIEYEDVGFEADPGSGRGFLFPEERHPKSHLWKDFSLADPYDREWVLMDMVALAAIIGAGAYLIRRHFNSQHSKKRFPLG